MKPIKDPDEYQQLALRTEFTPPFIAAGVVIQFKPAIPDDATSAAPALTAPQIARLLHGMIGLTSEIGEKFDPIKRALIYGQATISHTNLVEELGDLLWYAALIADVLGVPLSEVMGKNIAKLQVRYPNKFTAEAALVRDLPAEEAALQDGTPRRQFIAVPAEEARKCPAVGWTSQAAAHDFAQRCTADPKLFALTLGGSGLLAPFPAGDQQPPLTWATVEVVHLTWHQATILCTGEPSRRYSPNVNGGAHHVTCVACLRKLIQKLTPSADDRARLQLVEGWAAASQP